MKLQLTTTGHGPRLVLLHGWGLNSRVWDTLTPCLAQRFTVVGMNLPGHGASPWPPEFHDIDSLVDCIEPQILEASHGANGECFVLGWSLGSMAALALAARRPQAIQRLILVAPTPKFVRGDDWAHGVAPQTVEGFAERMKADVHATIREFLALQVQGDERAQMTLRTLRNEVLAAGAPHAAALQAGLEILRSADLRDRLSTVTTPTLVISGERDRLTPPAAGAALAAALPNAHFHLMKRAAHAPFISHAEEFCAQVSDFLLPHPNS